MTPDPASLANLRDLALPPPASFWPPAAGVWIVLVAFAAILAVLARQGWQRYRKNAYRRAARAELAAIEAVIRQDPRAAVERVSTVLKRVALVDYPRHWVASLSGPAWAAFLGRTGGPVFAALPIERLLVEAYDAHSRPDPAAVQRFVEAARHWVEARHRPTPEGP